MLTFLKQYFLPLEKKSKQISVLATEKIFENLVKDLLKIFLCIFIKIRNTKTTKRKVI